VYINNSGKENKKINPEGRNVYRGFKNMKCYLYPGYPTCPISQVFGVELDTLMRHPINKSLNVPLIFKRCIEMIAKEGPTTEGIFRVPGSKVTKDELKRSWNRGVTTISSEAFDVQDISDLLREFIRSIPQRVCPDSAFKILRDSDVLRCSSILQSKLIASALKSLSPYHRYLIVDLIHFLRELAKHHVTTKMNEENLSLVWSPNLFSDNFSLDDQRNITISLIKNLDVTLL